MTSSVGKKTVRWAVSLASIAAIAVGVVLLGSERVFLWLNRFRAARELRVLVDELGPRRTFEPRVHLSRSYSPYSAFRGAANVADPLPPRARIAAARLEQYAHGSHDPALLRDAGLAALLTNRFGAAVALLSQAHDGDARSPVIAGDLAAAYTVRRAPGDLLRALEVAAPFLHTTMPAAVEARFNAALVTEDLLPLSAAIDTWREYERTEAASEWRAEAHHHLAALERRSADSSLLKAVGSGAEEELPRRWAQACRSRAEPEWPVEQTLSVADHPDRYQQDLEEWFFSAGRQRCDPSKAGLYAGFARARRLYKQDQLVEALPLFVTLSVSPRLRGSPVELDARVYAAICEYFQGRQDHAIHELDTLAARARASSYLLVLGRAEWMRGYAAADHNRFQVALDAYMASLDAYQRASDNEGVGSAHMLIATLLDTLGEYENGWREREEALARLTTMVDSRPRYPILSEATRAAGRDRLVHVAFAMADVALIEARREQSAVRTAEALVQRAQAALDVGRPDTARDDLVTARRALDQLPVTGSTDRIRARLMQLEARTTRDPATTIERINEAVQAYSHAGSEMAMARLLLARGRAHRALGRVADAESDFGEGIRIFETTRPALSQSSRRLSYFDESWSLFEELIALRVERGEFEGALTLADAARARELLSGRPQRMPAQIQELLARSADAGVVYYVVLEAKTLICVITGRSTQCTLVSVVRSTLEKHVAAFRGLLRAAADEAQLRAAGAALYDAIFKPVESWLAMTDRLFVIPDPLLQTIPFAALFHAQRGQYLVQRYEIVTLPSAGAATPPPPSPAPSSCDAAIVAAQGRGRNDNLPLLPGARKEAEEIASLYSRPVLLLDEAATSARVLATAASCEVVHFAGHALVNPETPELSRLVLDRSGSDDPSVYAYEIELADLHRTRLVVLSACDTAAGRTYRSEGVVSLARSFIRGGVPTVVATLWSVRDDVSREFFRDFHSRLRSGDSTARALRGVQIAMIRSANPVHRSPAAWAAVLEVTRLIG